MSHDSRSSSARSRGTSRAACSRSSSEANSCGLVKQLTTTQPFSARARLTSDSCPSWSMPMVGTKPTASPAIRAPGSPPAGRRRYGGPAPQRATRRGCCGTGSAPAGPSGSGPRSGPTAARRPVAWEASASRSARPPRRRRSPCSRRSRWRRTARPPCCPRSGPAPCRAACRVAFASRSSLSAAKPIRNGRTPSGISPTSATMSGFGTSSTCSPAPSRLIFFADGRFGAKSATAAAMTRMSAAGAARSTASRMAAAVVASTTVTPRGGATLMAPAISVTDAPRSRAASAMAAPILPLLRLPMKRTGSSGSRVPPALTTTCSPSRSPARAKSCSTASTIALRLGQPADAGQAAGQRARPPGRRGSSRSRAASRRCAGWRGWSTCRHPWPAR